MSPDPISRWWTSFKVQLTLGSLFLGRDRPYCLDASDFSDDGNGERELSDAVYALAHLFQSGPEPPAPYPRCDRIDVPVEECLPGSTGCE